MRRTVVLALLGFGLGVFCLSFGLATEIRVPVGSARGPLMVSGLGQSEAAIAVPDEEAADSRRDFYFRQLIAPTSQISIPLRPRGPATVSIRFDTTVRSRITATVEGRTIGDSFVAAGRWQEWPIAAGVTGESMHLALAMEDAPLVRRSDTDNFRRYVDEFILRCESGFDLPWTTRLAGGALVALAVTVAASLPAGFAPPLAAIVVCAGLLIASFQDSVALSLALPRLVGFIALCAGLVFLMARAMKLSRSEGGTVALLSMGVMWACGYLSFLPDHSPADLDIHIWRTIDLASVEPSYVGWLRYGSHYPTPSQVRGAATEALGEGPAIPYSPLPYLIFYGAHVLGLDLHWSMNAIESLGLALLLPLMFALGKMASSSTGALLAAALMALDLATIHRLGRAHSPAVLGGALGLAALLAFGLALSTIDQEGQWKKGAALLGVGALGYSSTPVFYALFGTALVILLLLTRDSKQLAKPVALCLVAGGALALVTFYGHYIPGLLGSPAQALVQDSFPGRTFFIFHNESRQSVRLWRLGLFVPFIAAIPAAFTVFRRSSEPIRSFLFAWLSAWAGIMLLKEPWAFPRLLRWAKEDFYVAPVLALLIAIAIARIESTSIRRALVVVALVVAACLRINDYAFHANTLRFLR